MSLRKMVQRTGCRYLDVCGEVMQRSGIGYHGYRGYATLVKGFLCLCLILNYVIPSASACPALCTCKWKSGKQTVECENLNLSALPDGIYPETQVLNISGNRLGILPRDAFLRAGLLNLQRIYVRNSRLRQIDPLAFNELINLVELDLSDNLLTAVPSNAFKSTQFLRELNLAGNSFGRIPSGAFEFATQLMKLDLSRSHLTRIDDSAFVNLKLLESLKITSNQLTTLNDVTVKSFSHVRGIELHDNPWDCDCHLRDLKVWIETKKIPHPVSPTCHSPARLSGKRFFELGTSDFACPPGIIQSIYERQIGVTEGENATLTCSVDSLPITSIHWYSQRRLITNNMGISAHRKFLIIVDEESGRSNLTLTNALQKDSGDFVCVVENAAGVTEANFTLDVFPPEPTFGFPTLDLTHVFIICVGLLALLLLLSVGVLVAFWRRRGLKSPGEDMAMPHKPPRLNYDVNPVTSHFVANGYAKPKVESTDNPDLILETNNSGSYQETGMEEQSSNSELNWEQQSYRNLGYATEYPPDYGLPIIPENSVVYNDSGSCYGNGLQSNHLVPLTPLNSSVMSGSGGGGSHHVPMGSASVISGVWGKNNKVGTRIIRAPSARDSPDEGYQEGYCGTDV